MDDEQEVSVEQTAEQEETEPQETVDSQETSVDETAEQEQEEEQSPPEPKKKTAEDRINELYGRAKRSEREIERLLQENEALKQAREQKIKPEPKSDKPKIDDYSTYEEYVDDLTDWKLSERDRLASEAKKAEQAKIVQEKWDNQIGAALAKDPDFLSKGYIPNKLVPFLQATEKLAPIALYFGENKEEAIKIASLPPLQAAMAIGRLEVKLASVPPQKTTTKKPAPTKGIGGGETPTKKPENMNYEEYKNWRLSGGGK